MYNHRFRDMIKEKRDSIHPVLLKFGVTIILSLGGFLFSRFRKNLIKPSQSPPSTSSGICFFDYI